ncbi:not available [Pontoporia blainvillei]|uniref:Not available n=1 Tax=Pontoporia blainvillei TaxID=48723 RepID=A0ABX0SAL4_PONBL|nr:not available [Pontoporia blainvillei]
MHGQWWSLGTPAGPLLRSRSADCPPASAPRQTCGCHAHPEAPPAASWRPGSSGAIPEVRPPEGLPSRPGEGTAQTHWEGQTRRPEPLASSPGQLADPRVAVVTAYSTGFPSKYMNTGVFEVPPDLDKWSFTRSSSVNLPPGKRKTCGQSQLTSEARRTLRGPRVRRRTLHPARSWDADLSVRRARQHQTPPEESWLGKKGSAPLLRGSPAKPKNVLARAPHLNHDTRRKLGPLELDRWLVGGIQGRSSVSKRSSHRDQTCLSGNLCVPAPLLHVAGFISPSTHAST